LYVFAKGVATLDESYLESRDVVRTDSFTKFGLTDCGIPTLAKNKYLVLTDDFKLANYLQKIEIDTINFNHIRPSGWKLKK
jgi:rRNA-processing protein FCF1